MNEKNGCRQNRGMVSTAILNLYRFALLGRGFGVIFTGRQSTSDNECFRPTASTLVVPHNCFSLETSGVHKVSRFRCTALSGDHDHVKWRLRRSLSFSRRTVAIDVKKCRTFKKRVV
ncbi:hypothetical protein M408DRAFT_231248 [Serendipita vermifera MAFF 305830]|uniref:Uncharacterized protein n=1 Tax=Serendipita vermifera MAFF 305830 TaxID=933852 RepID=A0A0C3A405_SERVB|nr:hypothetical protein M408DRAFT_231248 [Serendipita vermifera MAFF 305830]